MTGEFYNYAAFDVMALNLDMTGYQVRGTKDLTNGSTDSLAAGQFRFNLIDADTDEVIDTTTNDENGDFTFGLLTYYDAGEHNYKVVGGKCRTDHQRHYLRRF